MAFSAGCFSSTSFLEIGVQEGDEEGDDTSRHGAEPLHRSLPDNCVEYILFVLDSTLEPRRLLTELESIRRTAVQLCAAVAGDYIWQRDSFQLQVEREAGLVYLHGRTDYGDSIEDEWLIVYLLRRLSTSFPSLWVRVFDSDGEFLLVEAANVVPKWLNPEIDSNRVWIQGGKLQLLPLSASSGVKRPLSLREAVDYISLHPGALVHSPFIEAEAFYRLEKYPENIKDSMHHSLVTIPRKLAYILHEQPAAIAPAIEAFYLRDPISLKPLMATSPDLHFPPNDLVTVSVRFTKVLFAQVKSQRFDAPPLWSPMVKSTEDNADPIPEQEWKKLERLEMGMKVTSGFEMAAASANGNNNRLAREFAILLEDTEEEDGGEVLPTDEDIASWPNVHLEDDEAWLDINFEDFENELEGKQRDKGAGKNGFGDANAQADLRKIVSRFEDFLNDETAGLDGAELEDMDHDNDEEDEVATEDDEDDSSDDEDKAVSFDEDQFNRMMREMMGLPPLDETRLSPADPQNSVRGKGAAGRAAEDEEDEGIRQLAAQMEAELKGLGALKLDAKPGGARALDSKETAAIQNRGKGGIEHEGDESGDEEVDIDYNLAKNLLESFKSQAGLAGPAGNLLGLMGMKLPRDEDDEQEGGNTYKA